MQITETTVVPSIETRPDPVGELLERAADHLEKHGWVNFVLRKPRPSERCAFQAIGCVSSSGAPGLVYEASERFAQHLVQEHAAEQSYHQGEPCAARTIFRWNDAPERTREQVCRALREAAAS